ncbi:hypothetical protein CCHR01_16614, partial [Colletotrichum chrysophilum]
MGSGPWIKPSRKIETDRKIQKRKEQVESVNQKDRKTLRNQNFCDGRMMIGSESSCRPRCMIETAIFCTTKTSDRPLPFPLRTSQHRHIPLEPQSCLACHGRPGCRGQGAG